MKWPGKKKKLYGKSSTKSEAPQIEESKMPSNEIERTKINAILHSTQVTWHAKSTSASMLGECKIAFLKNKYFGSLLNFNMKFHW
jgi:hypothetical protein